jgi:hypothetical protein
MSLIVTGTGPSFLIETRYVNVVPFSTLTVLIRPRDAERVDLMLRRLHPRVPDRGPETAAPEGFDIRDPYGTADDREEQERDHDPSYTPRPFADAWLSTRSARRAELRAVERW